MTEYEKAWCHKWIIFLATFDLMDKGGGWRFDLWEEKVEGLLRDLKRNGINL